MQSTMNAAAAGPDGLKHSLRAAGLGVADDPATIAVHSSDLSYRAALPALAVVRPSSLESLAKAVAMITAAGCPVIGRGGGMSYTSGYTPSLPDSVILDLQGLDRVIEVNAEDMYVTVETGTTWKALNAVLEPLGLRTPYWGPLSGSQATVGGALSQNSLYHGSGLYHTVAESVLGLKVVLADGSILTTGSGARRDAGPFFRNFGPDVTGLFLGDTGAFGIKAEATLRLITRPAHTAHLSFKFDTLDAFISAQTALSRLGIVSECVGFDRAYNENFRNSGVTFQQGLSAVGKLARKGGLKALGQAARIAAAGKGVLEQVPYSLHVSLDGHTEAVVAEHVDLAAEICTGHGGIEMVNSIPTLMRTEPFGPMRSGLMDRDGRVWVAVHGFFPPSRTLEVARLTEELLASRAEQLGKHGISTRFLSCFSGAQMLVETIVEWSDELGPLRLSMTEPEYRRKWQGIPANPGARREALQLRDAIRDLYLARGAINLQIGKYYPYLGLMEGEGLPRLLKSLKSMLDPAGLMNPGSLGLP